MSTHVINFCSPASLGGESGSMAKQGLMSCWMPYSTRISRRPDGPFDSILHMLFWNVERPPHSSGTPRHLCEILSLGPISARLRTLADQHSPRAVSGSSAVTPAFVPRTTATTRILYLLELIYFQAFHPQENNPLPAKSTSPRRTGQACTVFLSEGLNPSYSVNVKETCFFYEVTPSHQ